MLVFLNAILDVTQMVVELGGDRTRLTVLAERVSLALVEVIEIRYRRDHGSSTASTSLLECVKLLLRDGTSLHLHAEVLSQLHKTLVGDGRQDARGFRSHVSVVLDTEEVGSAALVDILLLLGVEIKLAGITLLMSEIVGIKRSSIVAAHLILTGAERGRAVI